MITVIGNYNTEEFSNVLLKAVLSVLHNHGVFETKLSKPIPVQWNNGILFIVDEKKFFFRYGWILKK